MFNNIKETVCRAYRSVVSGEPMSDKTATKVVTLFLVAIGLVVSALIFNSITIVATMAEAAAIAAVGGTAVMSIITALAIALIPLVIMSVIAYRFYASVA